jgi:regulation of enolase protein 1 (concanavalin A-like superfamily)
MTLSYPKSMSNALVMPELEWTHGEGQALWAPDPGTLTLVADQGVDWSNDPLGGGDQRSATALTFAAPSDFSLSARVSVAPPRTTFDAAALCLWADEDHWAKLCFEYSPQGTTMVVSVVTNIFSDDCNSTIVEDSVYLRVSRVGPAWTFHASANGTQWDFVRLFRLHTNATVRVGFLSQAPMGDGCEALFEEIRLTSGAPSDLRDGS